MSKLSLYLIIFGVVIAVGSFYAGVSYQASKTPTTPSQFTRGRFNGNNSVARPNGQAFFHGEILSLTDGQLTLKLEDNSSKLIFIGERTQYLKSDLGSINDLSQGSSITVIGSANNDGSITAQTIQIGNFSFPNRPSTNSVPSPN